LVAHAKSAPAKVAVAPAPTVEVAKPVVDLTAQAPQTSNQTASTLLTLNNVPWGWVAIIIILILFFTVMYLLFNDKKV
jgi:hypothetical protein